LPKILPLHDSASSITPHCALHYCHWEYIKSPRCVFYVR